MKVGVIAVQGDVSEHVTASERAMAELGLKGSAVYVRTPEDMNGVDRLIIPGGESTTISKLLLKSGLFELIRRRAEEGMPVMGTCAGCILMAKKGDDQVEKTHTRLLGLMNMKVDRNFYGRQRESFEAKLKIDGVSESFRGVFIRAPAILEVWGRCVPLSRLGNEIVMAREDNLLGLAFHPELSGSTEVHSLFLRI
ncbi:MAG: pyridoxal 5'-phosphate synthase glutaminase subunit PdxT [Thermoplasmata archaeon]|uniref:Pyridoxal 5'-phosphate synthase subunit PdxT n=1 Tax=Candidatus Sysuiplasma superficiale TaxID=2823368 RepID=A0A8J7YK14_9ARCH|nr:pyridoxal 5'-phosphate synthase glutaminase subunit PdxT [Candidatus Sysuiplasma superficiale]MBX8643388.1 pyridoxal 5'-phosphate synthase glutaminase subunit PdxT [Candidatus Sysuiplasma superficiale]MCL4346772.1 pyridoxal 5'-phosphate synthase glutaminase subunit PdxT [Candidatus Thermoplasmatota archaeon]MCL5437434.1 pyridoxal 5'-phosphate synthase glutaminase subunit PdxT [Candidatus Thermoplasmatota archaeon]